MFLSKCYPLVILCALNLCLLYLCTHCIEYKCLVSGKGGEGEVNMWTVKDGGMWTGEGVRGRARVCGLWTAREKVSIAGGEGAGHHCHGRHEYSLHELID